MKKRVVITGLGVVSPIGNTVEEFWENIKKGKCGIDNITYFDTTEFDVKLAAEVKNFEPKDFMDRKDAKRMDRFSQFSVAAAGEALKMSGLELEQEDRDRIGVIVGSGIGGLGTIEEEEQKLLTKGPKRVSPMLIPKIITNMAAGNIAIQYKLNGISTNIVTACATGSHSIGEAYRAIQNGLNDVILAGGTESSIVPLGVAGFSAITALSTNTNPNEASRPFDKNRDGFVMGEGAGILVLEELEHAKKRGAKILAEVAGYGATTDAYHITSPDPEGIGASKAMEAAINEAKVEKEKISYINAHGTSTPYNDKFETEAIKKVFGEFAYNIPISSTKSMIGHLLGAAGAVEAIVCVKSIEDQYVHPTIGYVTKDPDCDLDYVKDQGRSIEVNYTLSNSLGFGGHNATLLIKKYSE